MARSNAPACLHNTHREEGSLNKNGGWQQWPADRGNWVDGVNYGTKYGIAAHTAKIRGIHPSEIRHLTLEKANALYMAYEWPRSWGDDWPEGFDQITYDATVNSGPGRGPLWTCRALGYSKADRAATAKAHSLSTDGKIAAIKRAVSGQRMGFLRSLSSWKTFGKGWGPRCARMEAIGVKMVLAAAKTPPKQIEERLNVESKSAGDTAKKQAGGAVTTSGAGGAPVVADPTLADPTNWLAWGVGAIVVLTIVILGYRAYVNYVRQRAYAEIAQEKPDAVEAA